MDEEIITQMGLILMQIRFARRALEDVERSTAQYGSFAFTSALSGGAAFGAPPLLNGALKVYVTNINDLTSGGGLGGFLEGLLGGVGRFFGGLFGGVVGGTLGGVTLPMMIVMIERIVTTLDRILNRLGIAGPAAPAGAEAAAPAAAPAETGSTLAAQLGEIRTTVNAFTALFDAAAAGPDAAAARSPLPATPAGERWLAMLTSAQGLIAGISRLVDGLILLVPILLGSLVLVIQRLDAIKLAVVEMLQFILRNVFLLRGAVLVTIFDTISSAARLAGSILGIVAVAVGDVLAAIFRMIGHVIDGAVAAFRFFATGIQRTIDGLLRWLLDTLYVVLSTLGELRIFRVLVHIVRIIPAVLPPLYELLRGSAPALTSEQLDALKSAASLPIPGPATPRTTPSAGLPSFPDVGALLAPPADVRDLSQALGRESRALVGEVRGVFDTAGGTLAWLGSELDAAARHESEGAGEGIQENLRRVEQRSDQLATALSSAQRAASERPETGLEQIASAYEQWLAGRGLETLLERITEHFQATSPDQAGSIAARTVGDAVDRPRASVEIEDVTIEIAPPPQFPLERPEILTASAAGAGQEQTVRRFLRQLHELQERGLQLDPDALVINVA